MIYRQLKAILAKENKMKDPFRVKKAVTFVINLDSEDGEDAQSAKSGDESKPLNKDESELSLDMESSAGGTAAKSPKKQKIFVVNATDDVQELQKAFKKTPVLSTKQRNS